MPSYNASIDFRVMCIVIIGRFLLTAARPFDFVPGFVENDPGWRFWRRLASHLPCTGARITKIRFPPSDDARAIFLWAVSIDVVGLVSVVPKLPLRAVAVAILAAAESLSTEVMHVRAHEHRHWPSSMIG